MFRIDSAGAITVLPTPAAPGSTSGYFSPGDAGLGIKGTVVSYDWMNAIQETVIHPIEQAGLTLSKTAPYNLLTLAIQSLSSVVSLPPIGSIFAFDDFNGALTFDTDYFAYCNGQTVTVTGIGSQVLKDLSGRYLVGYGTDGNQDIGSAAYSTSPVGNAGHTIDIEHLHTMSTHYHTGPSHTHTGPSHRHTGPSHTHSGPSHTHSSGTLGAKAFSSGGYFKWDLLTGMSSYSSDLNFSHTGSTSQSSSTSGIAIAGSTGSGGTGATGAGGTGYTSYSGTGATGAGGTGNTSVVDPGDTGNALSTTQSIQPRSVRVRYIMRIK